MLLLQDHDVEAHLTASIATDAARRALLDAHAGSLVSRHRVNVPAGPANLTFTVGGYTTGPFGFRVYTSWKPADRRYQSVLAWRGDHSLRAIAIGGALGALRTGALGGVAADALARRHATTVGLVGTGEQAWCQIWALAELRQLGEVRAFRRDVDARREFAERAERELGVACRPVDSAREAVEGADIVIVCTGAPQPVIDVAWLAPGSLVSTLATNSGSREIPFELFDRASVIVSDSPEQARFSDRHGLLQSRPVTHLGAVLAGDAPGRVDDDDIIVFWSAGLAGSEVVILDALADQLEAAGGALAGTARS